MSFIIIDKDNDRREAAGDDNWATIADCMADIKEGIAKHGDDPEFLPWRIVKYDRDKSPNDMFVQVRIKAITTSVQIDSVGGH
jgi:hypothetical protein